MANNKRGRRAKSPEHLRLQGTYRDDRHADRTDLTLDGQPVRPDHLTGEAAALWDSCVPYLSDKGFVCAVDSQALTAMCEWWAEYRRAADERTDTEQGLHDLAEAVRELADRCIIQDVSEIAYRVINDIGSAIEGRSMQQKRRVDRMAKSWREFLSIAGRFGLTPIDRQGIKATNQSSDDPFTLFLRNRGGVA
jgi:phage terminase small subunit